MQLPSSIQTLMSQHRPTSVVTEPTVATPPQSHAGDDFLAEMGSDKFVFAEDPKAEKKRIALENKMQREQNKREAQQRREERQREKTEKQAKKQNTKIANFCVGNDSMWATNDSEATAILGKDKLALIAKISQYKLLFPENKSIQKLKIAKTASVEMLAAALTECQSYIETSSIETFVTEAALQIISTGEQLSAHTRFNMSGLTKMLKENPNFNSLCRQLYLKYQVFSNVPPEQQLLLIVVTSAWVCIARNKQIAASGLNNQVQESDF